MTNHYDGIVLVGKSSWTKVDLARYADENGNALFNSVDVSGAKVINFQN